jgi:hypothetical protein
MIHYTLTNQHTAKYICKKSFTHNWELMPDDELLSHTGCRIRCRRCKEEKEI